MLEYREALELFRYDYETGVLYWRWRVNNRVPKTLEAGAQNKSNGYLYVKVHGRRYLVHRVVMLMCYGFCGEGLDVDHINHVRNDNRIENLRLVTNKQNKRNYTRLRNNTSGVTGVCWHKSYEKWQVSIHDNHGKRVYLGRFSNFDEAVKVRREAEKLYNYHPNHGDKK